MTSSLSTDDSAPSGEKSKEEVGEDLASALLSKLAEKPESASLLTGMDPRLVAERLIDRKSREKPKRRKKKKATTEVVDWSTPPPVESGAAEDLTPMISEEYEGMGAEAAKKLFTKYGMDWDSCGAPEFADKIGEIRRSRKLSDKLGSAMLAFCQHKIPGDYQKDWTLAVMAARDVHEGD